MYIFIFIYFYIYIYIREGSRPAEEDRSRHEVGHDDLVIEQRLGEVPREPVACRERESVCVCE